MTDIYKSSFYGKSLVCRFLPKKGCTVEPFLIDRFDCIYFNSYHMKNVSNFLIIYII